MDPSIHAKTTKGARLNVRVSDYDKMVLERGAEIAGVPVSQFVLSAALTEAGTLICDQTLIVLPAEEFDALLKRMDEPAKDLPALRRALERPSPFVEP